MSKYDKPFLIDFTDLLFDAPSVVITQEAYLNLIDNYTGFTYLKTKIDEIEYTIFILKLSVVLEVATLEQANQSKEHQWETRGWLKEEIKEFNIFINKLELSKEDLHFLQTFVTLMIKIAQQFEFMIRVENLRIPQITEENFAELLDSLEQDKQEDKEPFAKKDTNFGKQWNQFIGSTH